MQQKKIIKKPSRNNGTAKCKSEAQKKAIRKNYAIRAGQQPNARVEVPFPHFRYYRKSQHPALIVGEQKGRKTDHQGREHEIDEYRYRKVMHGEKDGRHLNEEIKPNPNPKDPEPMHIANRVRYDAKDKFENKPLPWKYPKK